MAKKIHGRGKSRGTRNADSKLHSQHQHQAGERMKFACKFVNADTDESRTVIAALSAREVESVDALVRAKGTETSSAVALEYALRAVYREVPKGFVHVEPPALIEGVA